MISNERQYRITKTRAEEFERALDSVSLQSGKDSPWIKVQSDAISGQLSDLRAELQEYESLKERGPDLVEVSSFEDVPGALVKARIAAGLTQRELADRLGVKEQQIQRYEATGYASASLERIQQVMNALGLKLARGVFIPSSKVSLATVIDRAHQIGISEKFINNRLFPKKILREDVTGFSKAQQETIALQLASRLERVFQIPSHALFGDAAITLPASLLAQTRFKLPVRSDRQKVNAYAVYAHYIALLVLQCTSKLSTKEIPTDPAVIHDEIVSRYHSVTLRACLEYVWDQGIPVLPLRESGAFHAACWRVNGRNVIVLKQTSDSSARWIVDLFHEVRHASEHPEISNFGWIESPEETDGQEESEIEATDFAVEVVLAGRAEEIARECAKESKGRLQALKAVVPRVADRNNVRVDVLANYLAHRLEEDKQDWWGTAQNLQETAPDPWSVTRDVLLSRIDCSRLNPVDLEMLTDALSENTA